MAYSSVGTDCSLRKVRHPVNRFGNWSSFRVRLVHADFREKESGDESPHSKETTHAHGTTGQIWSATSSRSFLFQSSHKASENLTVGSTMVWPIVAMNR